MLLKLGDAVHKLPFASKTKARSFFAHLEQIRNDIAHSRDPKDIVNNPNLLDQLLNNLIDSLKAFDDFGD